MTTNISPLSGENARHLLQKAMEQGPGTVAQERVAARLEQSIALGFVPSSTPGTACELAPAATTASVRTLMASSKLLLSVTLLAGVGIGVGVDRWAASATPHNSATIISSTASSQPTALVLTVGTNSVPRSDAMPTVRAEDLPRVPASSSKQVPTELGPGPVADLDSASPAPEALHARPSGEQSPSPLASLREQQTLLDQARLALGKEQPELCLDALAQHRSRFPQSLLDEERDALTIKALAASGNLRAARERAAAFLTRHPRSMLKPSLEATVGNVR